MLANGNTPLHDAAANGDVDAIRALAKMFSADVVSENNNGNTPLHLAARKGHADAARVLVNELGARVDVTNNNVCSPLQSATLGSHVDVACILVKGLGADVDARGLYGGTALHVAATIGNIEIIRVYVAAISGHSDVVRMVVEDLGAAVGAADNGETALHAAVRHGHVEVVRILIERLGTDVNVKTQDGSAPLHLAAMYGHADVARVLVKKFGADVGAKESDGDTALHSAARSGHTDMSRVLVKELPNLRLSGYTLVVNRNTILVTGTQQTTAGGGATARITPLMSASVLILSPLTDNATVECSGNVIDMPMDWASIYVSITPPAPLASLSIAVEGNSIVSRVHLASPAAAANFDEGLPDALGVLDGRPSEFTLETARAPPTAAPLPCGGTALPPACRPSGSPLPPPRPTSASSRLVSSSQPPLSPPRTLTSASIRWRPSSAPHRRPRPPFSPAFAS